MRNKLSFAALLLCSCARPVPEQGGPAPAAVQAPSASVEASAPAPPRARLSTGCELLADRPILESPRAPWVGAPLRVVAAHEGDDSDELLLEGPSGAIVASVAEGHGGPPHWRALELREPAAGRYRALSMKKGEVLSCKAFEVAAERPAPEPRTWAGEWPVRAEWAPSHELLFSAFIERLFDGPDGDKLTWKALHEVLRDPSRNLLHGHLGEGEDDPATAPSIEPDCADLPYTLRAYFAFKLGLPFGFSSCSRGGAGQPPRCGGFRDHLSFGLQPRRSSRAATFGEFVRVTLANGVHSGAGRARATDDETDFYPVPLKRSSLRPGTLYADPYGHVLMVVGTRPQRGDQGGVLLAVDGQPDGTVSRKRFWRGNFLFDLDPEVGSPGFKRFRPIVLEGAGHRQLRNEEIARSAAHGDYSLEQYERGVEGFYDGVEDMLSPQPRSPEVALRDTLAALEEQVKARVVSVENGRKFLEGGVAADMPKGAAIFETTGPWEDFSTPSRDLRLLIAIDVVMGLPAQIERRPARFAVAQGKAPAEARAELERLLERELAARRVSYTRTDGSTFELSLGDVVQRAAQLEAAYNPNDCPEHRWGAPAGSDEASTCRRRASPSQQAKMARARRWFKERKRPPRE